MFGALVISWFLTFGYVPQMEEIVNDQTDALDHSMATVAELGLQADYGIFSVYGSMENYQYKGSGFTFSPFRINYVAGAEIRVNSHVKFIFEHECDHSVNSFYGTNSNSNNSSESGYISNYTVIKVEFSGSTK